MHSGRRSAHLQLLEDWLSSIFPQSTVTLAAGDEPSAGPFVTPAKGRPHAAVEGAATRVSHLTALETHPMLLRSQGDHAGEPPLWLFPRLAPHRLSCDAVVSLGGYEGVDLSGTVARAMLEAVAALRCDEEPPVVDRDRQIIQKKKYWREWSAPRTSLAEKGSKLLRDCIMAAPDIGLSAELSATLLKGQGSAHRRQRVTVFIGFSNPETSVSMLNATPRESDRRCLRPAFGYSQDVLKHTLRHDAVAATRMLLDSTGAAFSDPDHGERLPPAFLLSACARSATTIAEHVEQPEAGWRSCAAIVRSAAAELMSMDHSSPLLQNLFLPTERFDRLWCVEAWLAASQEAREAALAAATRPLH
jgi:hypothetical protein